MKETKPHKWSQAVYYALALNTLSTLLLIPVYNDFGITGAPWTKGVKKGEVGGSVIIGGHVKKAEKEILSRLIALRKYLRTPDRDPHLSLEEIFRQKKKKKMKTLIDPLMSYFHNRKINHSNSSRQ